MLAYMIYENFDLSQLIPISVLNTTPNNIYLMFIYLKSITFPLFEIIAQTTILKEVIAQKYL